MQKPRPSTLASFSARRLKPSLAIGIAALGASAAHGAVIYNDFSDIVLGPDPNPSANNFTALDGYLTFNLALQTIVASTDNSLGLSQFRISAFDNKGSGKFRSANYERLNTNSNLVSSNVLGSGVTVNASNTSGFNNFNLGSNLSNVFAGIRVDAGGGNFNYGWIRFSTGPNSGIAGPTTITLLDAAYETTTGQGIVTSVPEPSTVALVALAGGAVALRLRRRRATE